MPEAVYRCRYIIRVIHQWSDDLRGITGWSQEMQEKITCLEDTLDPLSMNSRDDYPVRSSRDNLAIIADSRDHPFKEPDLHWQYDPTYTIGSWTDHRRAVCGSDLHRALKYLSSVNESLSLKKKSLIRSCSLLSEFFPASAFSEIPAFFRGRDFALDNEKAVITILAFIDLRLRLFFRDCIDPTIVHKVSSKYRFDGVTRNAVIQERKRLFLITLNSIPENKRKFYRKKYSRTRDIETLKLEQAALEKLMSIPGLVDRNNALNLAKDLFSLMKKACYRVGNPKTFLSYFPIAVYRVAGFKWCQLVELFGQFTSDLKRAVLNFLYRIGIRLNTTDSILKSSKSINQRSRYPHGEFISFNEQSTSFPKSLRLSGGFH